MLVSGTNGITIAAGSTDTVVLRHLDIDGLNTGLDGVQMTSRGQLIIEDSKIYGFTGAGVSTTAGAIGAKISVSNTTISSDAAGVKLAGASSVAFLRNDTILLTTNALTTTVASALITIDDCAIVDNTTGIAAGSKVYSFTSNKFAGNGTIGTITSNLVEK